MKKNYFILIVFCCFLVETVPLWAAGQSGEARLEHARSIAYRADLTEKNLATGSFVIKSWYRVNDREKPLRVYIEGDGFAWKSRREPATDPTPKNPIGLQLASVDPSPNVAYLGRPCQYVYEVLTDSCEEKYWTHSRFSEKVIVSMNDGLSALKLLTGTRNFELVGYSGGAAVALLILPRRSDILNLRTVAGSLDPNAVSEIHRLDRLTQSLDPMDYLQRYRGVPQLHFVGTGDSVIPASVTRSFAQRLGGAASCAEVVEADGATHSKGWVEAWPRLLHTEFLCQDKNSSAVAKSDKDTTTNSEPDGQ